MYYSSFVLLMSVNPEQWICCPETKLLGNPFHSAHFQIIYHDYYDQYCVTFLTSDSHDDSSLLNSHTVFIEHSYLSLLPYFMPFPFYWLLNRLVSEDCGLTVVKKCN